MDATWLRLMMMALGGLSLLVGYRLFCEAPLVTPEGTRATVLRNFVAGALLAVFGLGILFVEARALSARTHETHRGWNRNKSAEQGSYETPRIRRNTPVQWMA
jgi:hypothetical protein